MHRKFSRSFVSTQALGELSCGKRKAAWAEWAAVYRAQLQADGRSNAQRQAAQDAVNPAYVARNYLMQEAIRLAEEGDYSEASGSTSVSI